MLTGAFFALILAAASLHSQVLASTAFVLLHATHNTRRPVHVTRLGPQHEIGGGAGLLSLENQPHRLAASGLAPLIGLAADWALAADIASST